MASVRLLEAASHAQVQRIKWRSNREFGMEKLRATITDPAQSSYFMPRSEIFMGKTHSTYPDHPG